MNKTIKFLCWIAVIVILYACGSTSQIPPAVEEPQEARQKEDTRLYWDSGLERWKTDGDPKKDNVYVGEIRNGVPHGEGTETFPDGRKYVGEFKDGEPWNGTEYDKSGKVLRLVSNGIFRDKGDGTGTVDKGLFEPIANSGEWTEQLPG